MASERILITLEVDAKGGIKQVENFNRVIDKVPEHAKRADTGVGNLTKSLAMIGGATAIAATGMRAFRGAVDFVQDSIAASIEQQRIFVGLSSALSNVGVSFSAVKGDLDGLFNSLQRTTKYGDTDSAAALEKLIRVTGNYDQAMRLLVPTMEFASAMQIDMATAARLAGQASSGMTGTLSRYGIILDDTTKKQLAAADAMGKTEIIARLLNDKFGGSAAAELDAFGNKVVQLGNYWGDFKEELGDMFTELANNQGAFDWLIESIAQAIDYLRTFQVGVNAVAQFGNTINITMLESAIARHQKEFQNYLDKFNEGGRYQEHWAAKMKETAAILVDLEGQLATNNLAWDRHDKAIFRVIHGEDNLTQKTKELLGIVKTVPATVAPATAAVVTGINDVTSSGLKLVKTMNDNKQGFGLFNPATSTLGETIGYTLNPAIIAAQANLIELGRANEEVVIPSFKKAGQVVEEMTSAVATSFSDLLSEGISGNISSFSDVWASVWGDLAKVMIGTLGDAFDGALQEGGNLSGVIARFWDNLTGHSGESTTGDKIGAAVGVAGAAWQAYQTGGTEGIISGAISGAASGAAFGPWGAVIGGVVGAVSGWLGSRNQPDSPYSNVIVSPDGRRTSVSTREQGMTAQNDKAFGNDLLQQYRETIGGMNAVMRLFNDADLFGSIGDLPSFSFAGQQSVDQIARMFSDTWLPQTVRQAYRQAINAGLKGLGMSSDAIKQMWDEVKILDSTEQADALFKFVGALVGTAELIDEMDWNAILDDVNADSMQSFLTGMNEVLEAVQNQMLGMDDMTMLERADMAQTVNGLILQARQAEIAMLMQINQIQESINASIDSAIENINLGGMDTTEQSQYFMANIVELMAQLNSGDLTSPEAIQSVMSELLRYISQYQQVMGENLYTAGENGIIPAEWLTGILEEARELSNIQLEAFRIEIRETNDAILAELQLIYEALTLTNEERLGVDVNVNVNLTLDPSIHAQIEAAVRTQWMRHGHEGVIN